MRVILSPPESLPPRRKRRQNSESGGQRRTVPNADCFKGTLCHLKQVNLCGVAKKVNCNWFSPYRQRNRARERKF